MVGRRFLFCFLATKWADFFFLSGHRTLASDRVSEALSPGPQKQTPASVCDSRTPKDSQNQQYQILLLILTIG